MAGVDRPSAMCAVSQVAQHQLAEQRNSLFQFGRGESGELFFGDVPKGLHHGIEQSFDRVPLGASEPTDESLAGRHVESNGSDAGPVLPAVVLLLHEQKEATKPPERIASVVSIPVQRLQQPDDGKAAFVEDPIAHEARKVTGREGCCWG